MNIIADLHTHTLVSHHAYSSLEEMVAGAGRSNLRAIAITDHGVAQSFPEAWHCYARCRQQLAFHQYVDCSPDHQ